MNFQLLTIEEEFTNIPLKDGLLKMFDKILDDPSLTAHEKMVVASARGKISATL